MEIAPFSSRFKLYDQLELLEFPNKFFIKPVDSHHQGFSVDRRDVNIKPLDAGKLFRTGICISFRELLCLQGSRWLCWCSCFEENVKIDLLEAMHFMEDQNLIL
ncbi:unnamed protein product [Brassica oleracea]|uniref:(rape) hypothetical protein n=1 Tax=Brassica napus TaxID=3708 RepID=A0A816R850_BRANA|nr:unnamed protein product [Brassica napus]